MITGLLFADEGNVRRFCGNKSTFSTHFLSIHSSIMQYFNSALKGSDLKVRLLNLNVCSVINAEGKPTNSSAILSTALQYSIA